MARPWSTCAAPSPTGAIDLDCGADRDEVDAALQAVPGIGPWTAGYVRMRALGDPDVFLATDLGVRHGLDRLGVDERPRRGRDRATPWRPWRSYALHAPVEQRDPSTIPTEETS